MKNYKNMEVRLMEQKSNEAKFPTSYREVKMGRTVFRVTSVFKGEKDLAQSLEQLAIRKAMTDIKGGALQST
jgi:hypothetical protein